MKDRDDWTEVQPSSCLFLSLPIILLLYPEYFLALESIFPPLLLFGKEKENTKIVSQFEFRRQSERCPSSTIFSILTDLTGWGGATILNVDLLVMADYISHYLYDLLPPPLKNFEYWTHTGYLHFTSIQHFYI